jgi:metal-sulfur cluster biosynthetic enzyme
VIEIDTQAVVAALREVSDPELDESLVDLGFLDSVSAEDGCIEVVLRLPTFECAPNFAYLMAHDARQQALGVPGVRDVRVVLKDHMYSDEISHGVSAGRSFGELFGCQADGDDLEELRALFRGKAFGMRLEQLTHCLLDAGLNAEEVVGLRLCDVLDTSDRGGLRLRLGGAERQVPGGAPLARTYLERRQRLGLATAGPTPLITAQDGTPIEAADLPDYLLRMRRQRVSMTFNALMCRGLLETRYGLARKEEA